ncbi:hypothetical protein KKH43_05635 [Patescibacteria group bacterium]|nr:hypothetical protein [Patescibacteria group bacterium]
MSEKTEKKPDPIWQKEESRRKFFQGALLSSGVFIICGGMLFFESFEILKQSSQFVAALLIIVFGIGLLFYGFLHSRQDIQEVEQEHRLLLYFFSRVLMLKGKGDTILRKIIVSYQAESILRQELDLLFQGKSDRSQDSIEEDIQKVLEERKEIQKECESFERLHNLEGESITAFIEELFGKPRRISEETLQMMDSKVLAKEILEKLQEETGLSKELLALIIQKNDGEN